MSRFRATTKDNKEMAFGFDPPLSEYFVQVFDEDDELELDINSSGMSMCGPRIAPQSNSKMYEHITGLMCERDFQRYKPELEAILLDLPF
jgi:hypothetical protein